MIDFIIGLLVGGAKDKRQPTKVQAIVIWLLFAVMLVLILIGLSLD